MAHNYKRFTIDQLKDEEQKLKAKLKVAEEENAVKHIAVNRRKIEIVQSFMIDQSSFSAGDFFTLKETTEDLFKIDEMVGVIAWGYLVDPETYEKRDPTNRIAKLLVLLGKRRVRIDSDLKE